MEKKLMIVCSSQIPIPPDRGGAVEEIAFELARHMEKKYDVYVAAGARGADRRLKYVVLRSTVRKNKLMSLLEDMVFGARCIREVRRLGIDVLHLHTTFASFPIALLSFLLPRKTKIVYTTHSPSWSVPDSEIGTANVLFSLMEGFVMGMAAKITAVSESTARGILRKTGISSSKIIVVPNFSSPDRFSPRKKGSWKNRLDAKDGMILFVGKLTRTKGVDYLLDAMPGVVEKFPGVKLVMIGGLEHSFELTDNPWEERARKLGIENNVVFLGKVPASDLPGVYASSDVFVLPSLREGMPMSLLEAMASGLPVVATNVSGNPELVNKKCGILIKRKSPADISAAVARILSNRAMMRRMSAESRKRALEFGAEKVMAKYDSVFRSVTE